MLESAKVGQALRSALPSRVAPPAARRHITPPEPHAHVHRRCARPAQVWRPRRPLVCERAHWHRDPGSTTSSRRPRSEHQQVASRSPLLACACPPSRACQALCSLVCLGTGQLTRACALHRRLCCGCLRRLGRRLGRPLRVCHRRALRRRGRRSHRSRVHRPDGLGIFLLLLMLLAVAVLLDVFVPFSGSRAVWGCGWRWAERRMWACRRAQAMSTGDASAGDASARAVQAWALAWPGTWHVPATATRHEAPNAWVWGCGWRWAERSMWVCRRAQAVSTGDASAGDASARAVQAWALAWHGTLHGLSVAWTLCCMDPLLHGPSVCGPCISPCFGTDLCVVRVQLDRVQPVCMHPGSRAVDPGILLML